MRTPLPLLATLLLCLLGLSPAVAQQDSIDHWRTQGIESYQSGDFQLALNQLRLAKTFPGDQSGIDGWIEKTFDGYVVLLRKEKRGSELAGLAYTLATENPTHALRVAAYATRMNPASQSAQRQLHDILSRWPAPFYSRHIPHEDGVAGVAISADGQRILSAAWDTVGRLWLPDRDEPVRLIGHTEELTCIAFSPDSELIASGSMDNTIKLWKPTGEMVSSWRAHAGDVAKLAFSPNGEQIASVGWDGKLKLWTLSGELLWAVSAHEGFANSVAFSPDGQWIATGGWDQTAKLYSRSGELQTVFEGHEAMVMDVAFTHADNHLITAGADGQIFRIDRNGEVLMSYSGHEDVVYALAITPDDKYLLSSSRDHTIRLWDENGTPLQEYQGDFGAVKDLALSADGDWLVSATQGSGVFVWPLAGMRRNKIIADEGNNLAAYCLSADEQQLAVIYEDGQVVLRQTSGAIIGRFDSGVKRPTAARFSSDARQLVLGSANNNVSVWTTEGEVVSRYRDHIGDVNDVALSPGDSLIFSGGMDNALHICTLSGDSVGVYMEHRDDITSIALHPSRRILATASKDKTVILWNFAGEKLQQLAGHRAGVNAVAFSPDGRLLASAGADRSIVLWNDAGEKVRTLSGHEKSVVGLSFLPDSEHLISTGLDDRTRIWHVSGKLVCTLESPSPLWQNVPVSSREQVFMVGTLEEGIDVFYLPEHYLQSDRVYTLRPEQEQFYGLVDTVAELQEYPLLVRDRDDSVYESIVLAAEIAIQTDQKWENLYRGSFYYSQKGFFTPDIHERILLQRISLDNTERSLAIGRAADSTFLATCSARDILPFYRTNLASSLLAGGADYLPELMQELELLDSLSACTDEFGYLLQSRAHLLNYLSGRTPNLSPYVKDHLDALFDAGKRANYQKYAFVTGVELEGQIPIRTFLLEDLDFYEEQGVDPSRVVQARAWVEGEP